MSSEQTPRSFREEKTHISNVFDNNQYTSSALGFDSSYTIKSDQIKSHKK